ncbi:hypothetical protein Patl1_33136 [Pistacia atlantica]|uniref:Uncharacterized protein n=1 Tax=Pistacia atlantica TaxID=434234 RepID=A0ACC1ANI1_9ROSI|nr:hypothetical protein Patl1_33136 [Pistacia atlantica]
MKNQNDPVTLQWKVLGFGHENAVFVPSLNPYLGDDPAQCVAVGGVHSVALTSLGKIFAWSMSPNEGGGLSILSKVKALPVPMAAISCGGLFTIVLTEEGQLWNWGGDKVGGWRPKPIPSLEGVRIIQIASGGYHSLALTDEGKVLSWGYGGHGQLGHSSTENQKVPVVIEALGDKRVVYIACGGSSSTITRKKS